MTSETTSDFSQINLALPLDEDLLRLELLRHATRLSISSRKLFRGLEFENVSIIKMKLGWLYEKIGSAAIAASPNYINEAIEELRLARQLDFVRVPEISYILPIHKPNGERLKATLISVTNQIGVRTKLILIKDGLSAIDSNTVDSCLNTFAKPIDVKVIENKIRRGVSKSRNAGLSQIDTEFFSWIDSHDIIHPLRSLRSILFLVRMKADRVNTGACRIDLSSNRIMLRNLRIGMIGHSSFIGRTDLVRKYGYLLPLERHEDTEWQNRHRFFGASMCDLETVSHYFEFNTSAHDLHLSSDSWEHVQVTNELPPIGGYYFGKNTQARDRQDSKMQARYEQILSSALSAEFPCVTS